MEKKAGMEAAGMSLELKIPKEFVEMFKGEPRVLLKKLEWYGIHPVPPEFLSKELREMLKDYEVVAMPKAMMR